MFRYLYTTPMKSPLWMNSGYMFIIMFITMFRYWCTTPMKSPLWMNSGLLLVQDLNISSPSKKSGCVDGYSIQFNFNSVSTK